MLARTRKGVAYRGELLDILGPCRAEHQGLTVWSDLANNLSDLRLETHVQHSVGFVHNEVGDTSQVGLVLLKHVDKTTRSGDHNLDTALKVTDLRTLWRATINGSVSDARVGTKLGAFGLDLNSELSCGGEDEDDRAVSRSEERLPADKRDQQAVFVENERVTYALM